MKAGVTEDRVTGMREPSMTDVKVCYRCKETKDIGLFSRNGRNKDGRACECKACFSLMYKAYRDNNKEKIRANDVLYANKNKDRLSDYKKQWRTDNIDHLKVLNAAWKKDNVSRVRATNAERKARKIKATPTWSNKDFVDGIYEVASVFSSVGLNMHVDHIVPLKSKKVCGLHNEHNLRVTTAAENLSKNNLHWPDMW